MFHFFSSIRISPKLTRPDLDFLGTLLKIQCSRKTFQWENSPAAATIQNFVCHTYLFSCSQRNYWKVYILQGKINRSGKVASVSRGSLKLITRELINFSAWIKTVHTMPVEVCVGRRGPCVKVSRKLVLAIICGRTRIFRIEWMRIAMIPCRVVHTHTQTIVFSWLMLWFSINLEK